MHIETVLLLLLMIKHSIADLAIQSMRTPSNKSNIINPGLHLHAADHGILTFLVLIFFTQLHIALFFGIMDYIIHVLVDHIKSRILVRYNIPRQGSKYWSIQSVDQISHYLTYGLIVYLFANYV